MASESPPRNRICRNCNKPLKEPNSPTGHNIRAHQENPAASKRSWSGPSRSSDSVNLARPIPKPIKPKLSPKPAPVFPERFRSGNWSINAGNNHYHSSGSGDKAKTVMPWSYQNAPLNHPYPSGSGPFFMYNPDPSLALGRGDRARFSGNHADPSLPHGRGDRGCFSGNRADPSLPLGRGDRGRFAGNLAPALALGRGDRGHFAGNFSDPSQALGHGDCGRFEGNFAVPSLALGRGDRGRFAGNFAIPSLALGRGDRGRFAGNSVHGIGYPKRGTFSLAIPETPVGSSQRPVFKGPSKGSAFRPYKSLERENGESEDKRYLASKGKKRLSPEASEMPTVMKPPKRREVNLKIDPESHLKKEVKEQLLFSDFSCLEITNEDRAHLDLSLHL